MSTDTPLIVERGKSIPGARAGWAVVAIGKGAPTLLKDTRLSISERLFGGYAILEVDTSPRSFSEATKLPSRAASIDYDAHVTVGFRVTDPLKAAALGTNPVRDEIKLHIWPILEAATGGDDEESSPALTEPDAPTPPVAATEADSASLSVPAAVPTKSAPGRLKVDDLQRARQRIAKATSPTVIRHLLDDLGIELRAVKVTLDFEGAAKKHAETIGLAGLLMSAEEATAEVEEVGRLRAEELLIKGPRALLAAAMRTDPNMITTLLHQMSAVEQERYQSEIALLHKFLAEGHIEGHQLPTDVRDDFLRNLLNRASWGDILRLGAAADEAPKAVEDKSSSS